MRKTKIIATLGPVSSSVEQIHALIKAGVNVFRINFSHSDKNKHKEIIERIQLIRKELGIPLSILADTKGPEIRLGVIENDAISVTKGQTIDLVEEQKVGNSKEISINPSFIINQIQNGSKVLIDDGYIEAEIIEKQEGRITIRILNDGVIKSRKSFNIPYHHFDFPTLTEQDKQDISLALDLNVDYIAASFVFFADQIYAIRQLMRTKKALDTKIIAKIESEEGVKNLDSILEVVDGIMVARGDLGVEMDYYLVPTIQKLMIEKALKSSKFVIIATQLLESMITNPRATRAEVSDVANAIGQGASSIMLSGETAMGKYPIEAVQTMVNVANEAELHFNYPAFMERSNDIEPMDTSQAIAYSSLQSVYQSWVKAIIVFSAGGETAAFMSNFHPSVPIICVTALEKVYHQMAALYGVVPLLVSDWDSFDGVMAKAIQQSIDKKIVSIGDPIVILSGMPFGLSGSTNMMAIDVVGDTLVKGHSDGKRQVIGKIHHVHAPQASEPLFNKIAVITHCNSSWSSTLSLVKGIVLENDPEDADSVKAVQAIAQQYSIPYLVHSINARKILHHHQLVCLDEEKKEILKGTLFTS